MRVIRYISLFKLTLHSDEIGDVFLRFAPLLKVYGIYARHFEEACEAWQRADFQLFVQQTVQQSAACAQYSKESGAGVDIQVWGSCLYIWYIRDVFELLFSVYVFIIQTLLVLPMERVERYVFAVQQLKDCTAVTHADHAPLGILW